MCYNLCIIPLASIYFNLSKFAGLFVETGRRMVRMVESIDGGEFPGRQGELSADGFHGEAGEVGLEADYLD